MFQQSLQEMQRQAQELEEIKAQHLDKVLADEQKNFMFLVQKAAGVVKVGAWCPKLRFCLFACAYSYEHANAHMLRMNTITSRPCP